VSTEEARIKEAGMTARQIKSELDTMGVSYMGLLEKSEFVRALAEARVSSGGSSGDSVPNARTRSRAGAGVETPTARGQVSSGASARAGVTARARARVALRAREPAPEPEPEPKRESSEASQERSNVESENKSGLHEGGSDDEQKEDPVAAEEKKIREAGMTASEIKAELDVSSMRVSEIRKELDERGVSYTGLFEKSEYVSLLADARAKGITRGPGSRASGGVGGSKVKGGGKGEYDPSYRDLKVKGGGGAPAGGGGGGGGG
ncbi:unnamed protein product, partial [Discosporangium mesarthrocarpum]